jgi:hypothetical protein
MRPARAGGKETIARRPRCDAVGDDFHASTVMVDLMDVSVGDHFPFQPIGHPRRKLLRAADEALIGAKRMEVPRPRTHKSGMVSAAR